MRLTSFDYSKTDKTTKRVAVVLNDPSNHLFAIDVTELDDVDQGLIFAELMGATTEYRAKTAAIMAKYDVAHNYRRFDPLKMTNVVNET